MLHLLLSCNITTFKQLSFLHTRRSKNQISDFRTITASSLTFAS